MAYAIINDDRYESIICTVSGGADSDVMMDIIYRVDKGGRVKYVFFDTGLEYQATKEHLDFLEQKYGVVIERRKAVKPIPTCCKEYGQPFKSKIVSEYLYRLQRHNFKWEDGTYEELIVKYPKCKSALEWWCGLKGEKSKFNINPKLKAFIMQNPPDFKISNKCCTYAKKKPSELIKKELNCDLIITGVRRAEGGVRAIAYKSCFSDNDDVHEYRPLFWYKNEDKEEYERAFDVAHSKCYTEYGLKRTGCLGCPYGRDFEFELSVAEKYEPKLYKAITNIFGSAYEYSREYEKHCKETKTAV